MQPNSTRMKTTAGQKKPSTIGSLNSTPQRNASSGSGTNWKTTPDVVLADRFPGLSLSSQKRRPSSTGLMYDKTMSNYFSLRDPNYQECPARILEPFKKCEQLGLVDRCKRLEITPAEDSLLMRKHTEEYIEKIKSTAHMSDSEVIEVEHHFDDVSFHQKVMECARLSAGATVGLVEAVVTDQIRNGLAIIRPPGHHAMKSEACGYCYFNNVALAADHCINKLGLERVLIIDWDVHHGQGTQYMFYDDPRVMYLSIHRYEHGWFWPNLKEGNFDAIGEGKGKGYNINVPLNVIGMTDSDYLTIFHQLIMPLSLQFNPDVVIVSAGYDCAIGCPEGQMLVSPPAFSHFVHKLKSLANGKLAVIQEGGYNIESLSEGIGYTLRSLLDDACPQLQPTEPVKPELLNSVLNCINSLRPYWTCFQYQKLDYSDKAVNLTSSDPRGEASYSTEENKPILYDFHDDYNKQSDELLKDYSKRITEIVKTHPTRLTKNRTCFVYDEFMMKHKSVLDPTHPERPERISRIYSMLQEYGLLEKCLKLSSRKATSQELCLVHSMKLVNEIKAIEKTKPREYREMEEKYNSIYLHTDSYQCALMAAGSLLNVVDSVMTDQSRNGFAIIRPPGHHAEKDIACGFCFFNNVPVAARYAQQKHGAKKILIVDWDVHHGNGTQHMFESDDTVLYVSLHRYDDGTFFPGSNDANYDKVGHGKGEGYNVNIPFNVKYKGAEKSRAPGDAEYIAAFQQIIMPICYEFSPDAVFISAGFDAAKDDPLGGYKITPAGYAHMTHMLSSLANGRVILALEGGYNLNSISECFSSCVDVMLGGAPPRIPKMEPDWAAVESIQNVINVHKKYWKSLCCDVTLPYNYDEISKLEEEKEKGQSDEEVLEMLKKLKKTKISSVSPTKPTVKDPFDSQSRPLSTSTRPVESAAASTPQGTEGDNINQATGGIEEAAVSAAEAAGACGGSDIEEQNTLFAVVPLKWCAHLEEVAKLEQDLDAFQPCFECGADGENWVCLTCYKVYCSRYVNEHMLFHSLNTDHKMVLSYADLSVWCYACDAYVHNQDLLPMKNSAHRSKFGQDQPDWASYLQV